MALNVIIKLIVIGIFLIQLGCAPSSTKYYIKTVPTSKKIISKVAIIPENLDSYWVSQFSYRALITELMHVGFTVVERSNLTAIVDEQKTQQSGLIKQDANIKESAKGFILNTLDQQSIVEIGEILGVDKLILTYVVPSGRELHMATIRLVDVETAVVLISTTIIAPKLGESADIIMKQVALDLADAANNSNIIIRDHLFGKTSDQTNTYINYRLKGDKLFQN